MPPGPGRHRVCRQAGLGDKTGYCQQPKGHEAPGSPEGKLICHKVQRPASREREVSPLTAESEPQKRHQETLLATPTLSRARGNGVYRSWRLGFEKSFQLIRQAQAKPRRGGIRQKLQSFQIQAQDREKRE
jgi:hypothetical protein